MKITNTPVINNRYGTNNININANKSNNKAPNFKGNIVGKALAPLNEGVYKLVLWLSNTKGVSKLVNSLANSPKSYNHLQTAESVILTGFYMYNTVKNKGIKKEQKFPLMVNDAMVTALATVLSYTLDKKIDKTIGQIQDTYKTLERSDAVKDMMQGLEFPFLKDKTDFFKSEIAGESIKKALGSKKSQKLGQTITDWIEDARKSIAYDISHAIEKAGLKIDTARTSEFCSDNEKAIVRSFVDKIDGDKIKKAADSIARSDKVLEGVKLAKKMVIFAVIYRYISPVLITPLANKVSGYLQHKKEAKLAAAKTQTPSATTATTPAAK